MTILPTKYAMAMTLLGFEAGAPSTMVIEAIKQNLTLAEFHALLIERGFEKPESAHHESQVRPE